MNKLLVFAGALLLCAATAMAGTDSWKQFVAEEGGSWKPHFQEGRIRSLYGLSRTRGATPMASATMFLQKHASLLGIADSADLRLESSEDDDAGTAFVYQQYYRGYKVVGGQVLVHTNRDAQIISVASDFKAQLFGELPRVGGPDAARLTAARYLEGRAVVSSGELVVFPMGNRAKLAWRLEVDSTEVSRGSYLMYVDAANPRMVLLLRKTYATAEGKADIFLQNPVVTPSTSMQTLKNMDGSKKLAGKFAETHNANFEHDVSGAVVLSDYTTASDPGRVYDYPTTDGRLSEAMAYFHINVVHDRWRSFGFQKLNAKAPVFVNVTEEDGGPGLDNAFYTRNARFRTGIYVFGAGDHLENLGFDCDVYYHEYGHGVLDHQKPGLFEAFESNYPGSFHEGFGDISDAAITGNSKIGEWGLRLKSSKQFVGRNIQNTNSFPQDVILPSLRKSEVHYTGLIVGGVWWDLRQAIGADAAQSILFKSINLMPAEMNFFDWRDAMLTADQNANGGANAAAISAAFTKHGLGGADPGQPGSVNVTALKAGAYNANTGKVQLKSTFKRGDTIVIVANYHGTGLVPGYNLIPVDADLKPPQGTPPDGFLLVDEAGNGTRTGNNGAFQAVLFTDSGTAKGQYTVSIQSRLGGTSKTSAKKTVKFKLN